MQLNVMPLSELLITANNYAASIKELGIYSDLVKELCIRLDAGSIARREITKQRDALAAENAGLKSDQVRIFNSGYQRGHEAAVEGYYVDIHQNDMTTYHEDIVAEIAEEQTPATDAFLREVQNEAGARAVELFSQTLGSPYAERDEPCYENGFNRAIEFVRDFQAPRFAAELRNGEAV